MSQKSVSEIVILRMFHGHKGPTSSLRGSLVLPNKQKIHKSQLQQSKSAAAIYH